MEFLFCAKEQALFVVFLFGVLGRIPRFGICFPAEIS